MLERLNEEEIANNQARIQLENTLKIEVKDNRNGIIKLIRSKVLSMKSQKIILRGSQ